MISLCYSSLKPATFHRQNSKCHCQNNNSFMTAKIFYKLILQTK
nr:MAG TPA: hypothetical protein [Caudoviricetes sp.]